MSQAAPSQPGNRAARPFLKWAGGKTQLLAQFVDHYPPDLACGRIRRYVEPFLGGGAVFLDVVQRFSLPEVFLFDINAELILAYRVVQREPQRLIELLRQQSDRYFSRDEAGRKAYFYAIRDAYNEQRSLIDYDRFSERWIERAAYMIFLNKTCYNGLFRVNSRGKYNVPYGRYRRPAILDEGNILRVSALLQRATLRVGRFDACAEFVDDRTFVYFDPPYRPISSTANFTAYSSNGFCENEQVRLAQLYADLDATTDAMLMLSNSDPTHLDPADDFFEAHFAPFQIHRVHASRMINANAKRRGKIPELVITNY